MNGMSCESVREKISFHVDGLLTAAERGHVVAHLASCRVCGTELKSLEALRASMRNLDRATVPARLSVELRVLASHERVRQLARASFSARLRYWAELARLKFDNLMKPMALPLAGGLLSALLLFGVLVPNLSVTYKVGGEPPLALRVDPDGKVVNWVGEQPRLLPVNAETSGDETVVELTIDNRGYVVDYTVLQGELTPDLQSIIMFSQFTPATFFYQPTWGKMLVTVARRRTARG